MKDEGRKKLELTGNFALTSKSQSTGMGFFQPQDSFIRLSLDENCNLDEEKRLSNRKEQRAVVDAAIKKLGKKKHKSDSEDELTTDEDEDEENILHRSHLSSRDIHNSILLALILTIRASVAMNSETPPVSDSDSDDSDDGSDSPPDFSKIKSFYILPVGETDRLLVREYAGKVFQKFRQELVSTENYLWSWSQAALKDPKRSYGKSDSSFIHSYDNRFIIKTLTSGEAKWLRKILPSYCRYMEANPNSRLTPYLGLYRLSDSQKNRVYFTVTPNIFGSKQMNEIYDVKGSVRMKKINDPNAPLLDNDINRKFKIGKEKKDILMAQLKRDTKYLAKQNIMDYSLLLGVYAKSGDLDEHDLDLKPPGMVYFLESEKKRGEPYTYPVHLHRPLSQEESGALISQLKPAIKCSHSNPNLHKSSDNLSSSSDPQLDVFHHHDHHQLIHHVHPGSYINSTDGKEVYYLGIIDFLQKYNSKVKFIGFAQSLTKDKEEISSVAPGFYSRRFREFVDTLFE